MKFPLFPSNSCVHLVEPHRNVDEGYSIAIVLVSHRATFDGIMEFARKSIDRKHNFRIEHVEQCDYCEIPR